jgi:DNA-binding transcriptional MocR family regulator
MTPVPPEVRSRLAAETVQLWSDPGVTDLGIGQPQDAILPTDLLSAALHRFGEQRLQHPWQYGHELGDGVLRTELADFLEPRYGVPVDPDLMLVTNGNSQAIDLCCGVLAAPGDVVFVEEPSYHLAMQIFRDHHLRVVGIPVDRDGLSIEALEDELTRHRPAFLYTIPAAQNPTGATLPTQRRRRLVELAQQHGFLVVADEVYHLLQYGEPGPDGRPAGPEPMAAYVDSGVVLSLGTFSKILAPGLRLGWVQAARPLLDRLESRGFIVSGGGLNPVPSALVAGMLADGSAAEYLASLLPLFRARVEAMDAGLRAVLPAGASWARPDGGYFFWLRLPDGVDTAALLPRARSLGVGYAPGPKFSSRGGLTEHLRLSFAYYGDEQLAAAVRALGQVFG